ncbi:MAG: DeoR/GlpR transcriptional regulator, partial [Chloroflexi bacterium]
MRDMADLLGTSEITVRRDLTALAGEGLVQRTHGGAVLPHGLAHEPTYREKATQAAAEKAAIARLAVELVQPGDSIVLGAGTTTLALARELRAIPELTVVTNSLLVAEALMDSSGIELLLTGGTLR